MAAAIRRFILITALAAVLAVSAICTVSSIGAASDQKVWRVIYVEGGGFRSYYLTFIGIIHGLRGFGLIDNGDVPMESGVDDTTLIWQWLVDNAGGDKLKFLPDGHYSAGWDEKRRAEIKEEVLRRLHNGEVDLIIAFGTAAGQDFVTNEHSTPVISISTTDPVAAGISLSATDSGLDHAHVQVESGRVERQVAMFHNIFEFKRLGIPYDATPDGRQTLGLSTVEVIAKELGFEVVPCITDLEIADYDRSYNNLIDCLDYLSGVTDAVYLTANNGMRDDKMDRILAPMLAAKIPTFSQKGPSETKLGVLMSLAEDGLSTAGRFEADVIKRIIEGEKPRNINQIYVAPLTLALNLKMALAIGWNPPFEVLAAVDELYNEIAGQE